MRRSSAGTLSPRRMSVRHSPSRLTAPASGVSSPEITLTRVLLPLPECPKIAMTPGVGAVSVASRRNPGSCLTTETSNTSAAQVPAHAPHQELRGQQSQYAEREGQYGEPQRERVSARGLHRGVEGERQRARDTRHVGGEGNHGAELAQPGGESSDGTCEYSRQHERERDGDEAVERCRAERARRILQPAVDMLERETDGAHHEREGHDRGGERRACRGEGEVDSEMGA